MAETAVKFLLGYVSQLYIHQTNLISGSKYELRQLMDDLNSLQALLGDVATRPTEEEPMGDIKRGIKEAVYDLEDAIDTCLTFEATARTKSSSFVRYLRGKNDLGTEVRTLRESKVKPQIEKLKKHVSTLPSLLPSLSDAPTTSVEDPRNIMEKDRAILMREDNVVGLKNEEEIIINCLMEQSDELDVISIVGMRGLGKTTLAWKIYQNERIGCKFPTRIWVHVSQNFNEREAFLHILERFTSQDVSRLSDEELLETVRACLEKEKFLLVLDDVCNLHHWEVMRRALPGCNGTSKVMITSSDDEVGANLNVPRDPHKLRLLTKEESWGLLQLEVFGRLSDCPPQLEEIGKDIAGKCNGLPLQIVAVGGILVDLSTKSRLDAIKDRWKTVCENENLFLNDNNGAISEAVKLTYGGLCDELKECFLYMGVFPEGYEISASTLTRLWIAEGFIQPKERKSLEEAAAQNLGHLINRNLVMVDKINSIGEVKTCRLPDMIRGFCINEARKQNLFEEISVSVVPELHRIRRLCVYGHSDVETLLSQLRQTPRLRSFLCFRTMPSGQDPSKISTILDKVDLLKVFEFKSIHFNHVPGGITKLFHLRYITLSLEDLNVLPEGLSVLWNLQTLIIETRARCITVKANIWKLIQLRHLQINAAIVLSSKGGGEGGENLQTLSSLSPESCTEVQERAQNLKKLGIRGKLDTLSRHDKFLKGFTLLEKLKLVNDSFPEIATSKNRLQWLAHSDSFPRHLKWLTLSNTFLEWKHMSTLGKINTLEVLKLKDNAFTGIYWNTEEDCFRSLVFLLIANTDLVIWEASDGALPSLRRLVLKNCRNLSEFPVALKCLEKLEIEHVNESAVTLATRIAEEKTKSSHSS